MWTQVWERMARLKADVLSRMCRYYHPIILDQGHTYCINQLQRFPLEHRFTSKGVERILGMGCSSLIALIRAPDTPLVDKVEGFSVLRSFENVFFSYGLFKMLHDARKGVWYSISCMHVFLSTRFDFFCQGLRCGSFCVKKPSHWTTKGWKECTVL